MELMELGDWVHRLMDLIGLPRRVGAQAPLGAALADHLRGLGPVDIRVLRSEGFDYTISSEDFFSEQGRLADLDSHCLDACVGRVLDVGAGAGRQGSSRRYRGRNTKSGRRV